VRESYEREKKSLLRTLTVTENERSRVGRNHHHVGGTGRNARPHGKERTAAQSLG
jgi:hypothetical protein